MSTRGPAITTTTGKVLPEDLHLPHPSSSNSAAAALEALEEDLIL
jgi:hypothetical protein